MTVEMLKPLSVEEVAALFDAADTGPIGCECHGDPSICTCSIIGRICIEWMKLKGFDPQPVFDNQQLKQEG